MPIAPGSIAPHHDQAAKPALYAFFKNDCPTCQLAFPVIAELERRYGDAIAVVAVSQDPLATAEPWLANYGFAGPVIDDSVGYPISAAYSVDSVPTLVLVDEAGVVVAAGESWDRDRYNAWAVELGERTGRRTDPVSTPEDGLPPFKPG